MIRKLIFILITIISLKVNAITATSYLILDPQGNSIKEYQADIQKPIGSITKLIFINNLVLDPISSLVTITKEDLEQGRMKSTPLRIGRTYTKYQLIELALVSSDNVAVIALSRLNPVFTTFANTSIVEASGLNPNNISTARDIALLAHSIIDSDIAAISTKSTTEVGNRHNTNPFIDKPNWKFYLSKTGFIRSSGGCLVVVLEIKKEIYTIVILGSKNVKERWKDLIELRKIIDTTYVTTK